MSPGAARPLTTQRGTAQRAKEQVRSPSQDEESSHGTTPKVEEPAGLLKWRAQQKKKEQMCSDGQLAGKLRRIKEQIRSQQENQQPRRATTMRI